MKLRVRRFAAIISALVAVVVWLVINPASYDTVFTVVQDDNTEVDDSENGVLAREILDKLEVKGRAPKTGYSRDKFYNGWPTVDGCNLRQRIIKREFGDSAVLDGCTVERNLFVGRFGYRFNN